MTEIAVRKPLSPEFDPWDPIHAKRKYGQHVLTSIEITVTLLCNLRCEHCAVGEQLVYREPERIPLPLLFQRLDEVETLETLSITGGEPMVADAVVNQYVIPILKYAKQRGLYTQLNSNLTMDRERYERIAPYVDVLHISWNWDDPAHFHEITFGRKETKNERLGERLFEQMVLNIQELSRQGVFISAETMMNTRTRGKVGKYNRLLGSWGVKRHEIHPMYPVDFASELKVLPLEEIRQEIHQILDERDPEVWILFGTLPFFWCNADTEDQMLLKRIASSKNVTVRNDPDGRNRLNINLLTGDVVVSDFSPLAARGNIRNQSLGEIFAEWQNHRLFRNMNCHCDWVSCTGPNLLVADMYYKGRDFKKGKAMVGNLG